MKYLYAVLMGALVGLNCACTDDKEISLSPIPTNSIAITNAFTNLNFSRPLDLQSPQDGTNRIFVAEQGGVIKVFENNGAIEEAVTFLDLSDKTVSTSELGLLGFAFHPNYITNGFIYVTYTPSADLAVISRFKVSATNSNSIEVSSENVLLQITQPFTNYNGGQLAFGPDGYLYIATGGMGEVPVIQTVTPKTWETSSEKF